MSPISDYLTKQIYIEKEVVTFRSLSRQFGLHVNASKNELANFHSNSANAKTRSFATFLISGELFPKTSVKQAPITQTDDGMDVDTEVSEKADEVDDGEEVPTTTMTLVTEDMLEHAKARYARIFSTHVYCLSPSPLADAGFICDPSAIVYKADAKDAPASSIVLGRVVGPDVKVGKVPPPVASSSKVAQPISRKPTLKVKDEPVTEPQEEKKGSVIKPKASGKLDWSKAKKPSVKSKVEEEEDKVEVRVKKEKSESPAPSKASMKREGSESSKDEGKRGTKRKANPPPTSDVEDKPDLKSKPKETAVPVSADVRLRKNRIVSDDEDEDEAPRLQPKAKAKAKTKVSKGESALESDAERSLRAMMDIDDSQVEMASTKRVALKSEPQEDVEMASEPEPEPKPELPAEEDEDDQADAPKPKPRKRKEKKVIPVGRNGLKKKRVVKSRMTVDAKGYMVTEDYSSYESVDEEEEEAPKKPKGKKASGTSAKEKKDADEDGAPKSKPVARTGSVKGKSSSSKGGQGNLKDFFGKPKK